MVNVNRNSAFDVLQGMVEQNFSNNLQNMSQEFNEKQQMALDLFKQRVFLDQVIEESLAFNRKLNWYNDSNVKLTTSAEELIEVYKLRSDIYTDLGYQKEFPDVIEGLNFDLFDKNSAILYCNNSDRITGTLKVVFDSNMNLPTEDKISFNNFRKNKNIVELSRFIIRNENNGLNQEFKYLFLGVYSLYEQNNIDFVLSGIKKDHYKLYSKFGGVNIEYDLEDYGKLGNPSFIVSWDPSQISPFFKRAFLNIK